MKFKFDKKTKKDVHHDGSSCDVDLRTCAVELDNGVIVEKNPSDYTTLVNNLIMCDSPACGTSNLI
jgi:hypothetical protein